MLLTGTYSFTIDINGRPTSCFATSFALVPYFFSYVFCVRDFSKTTRSIYMKLSDLIDIALNLIELFLLNDDVTFTTGFEILTIHVKLIKYM